MFDWVPGQVWLLLLMAFAAYPAAKVVCRDVRSFRTFGAFEFSKSRDRDGNRSFRFWVSITALFVLVALAILIFTPQAEAFARSPDFVPSFLGLLATFSAFTTANDVVTGKATPLIVRGDFGPYLRTDDPWRYWASIISNAGLALLLGFLALNIWRS